MKLYKVLGNGGIACNGGSGKWNLPVDKKPGKWMPKIENIIPCRSGYHLCRREDLLLWLNEEIYEAEGRGKSIRDENKDVFQQARLIRKIDNWNEKNTRLFATDCVEHVLNVWEKKYPNNDSPRKAIQAARDFANGIISNKELSAAESAARSTVRSVAWSAVRSAGHKWETERLFYYLEKLSES